MTDEIVYSFDAIVDDFATDGEDDEEVSREELAASILNRWRWNEGLFDTGPVGRTGPFS